MLSLTEVFPNNFNSSSNNHSSNEQEHDVIISYPTRNKWLTKNDRSQDKELEEHCNSTPNNYALS